MVVDGHPSWCLDVYDLLWVGLIQIHRGNTYHPLHKASADYRQLEKHLETAGDGIYRRMINRFGGRNRTDREQGIKDELD